MADVTGPISSLPGAMRTPPEGTMCDDHPERLAYRRVQGETDSFGCEMHDLCEECVREMQNAVVDTSGHCDWCKQHKPKLFKRRDSDEGMSGPVYDVCSDCTAAVIKRRQQEQEEDDAYYGRDDPLYDELYDDD